MTIKNTCQPLFKNNKLAQTVDVVIRQRQKYTVCLTIKKDFGATFDKKRTLTVVNQFD
jgi:hypothetical protein